MSVLIARHPLYERHDTGPGHPERPSRLAAVVAGIRAAGLEEVLVEFEPEPAHRELVVEVHPGTYLERLETLVLTGGRHVDADTVIGADSLDAAMVAAGAGLGAIERLDRGEASAAFCAVRPPGPHATRATAMGFCLVNNVAVAARTLADRGERVLIVDIDAHHGNGTQDVFYDDPRVLFVSLHEYPLYPGTGRLDEVGEGIGLGTTVNLPFPAHTTGDVYRHALDRLVLPAAEAFGPTWLLVSAGFDGHRRDPLTGLGLTSGDFADMTRELLTLAPPGRRLFFLEGGYDLQALSDSVGAVLAELAGVQFRPEPPSSGGPGESVVGAAREWHERAMDIGPSDLSAH